MSEPLGRGGRPLARRVLASFAVVVVAFAATVFAGLYAQRRAAQDVEDLSFGYLPLETALARTLATQWGVPAVIERMLDDPRAASTTRDWLKTLGQARPAVLAEARRAALGRLAESADEVTRNFGKDVARELDAVEREMNEGAGALPDLFGAIEAGDKARATTLIRAVSARERAIAERLDGLAQRIRAQRDALVAASAVRDRRAMALSVGLALVSLIVAAVGTREVSRRLAPLETLTERAQAIASGDRSPLPRRLIEGPRDEIRQLAVAFGAMVEGVASRDADLLRLRRRQEDIVNHLRAAVVALRADGVVETANPAAQTLLGVREGDRLPDATAALWNVVKSDVSHAIDMGIEAAARTGVNIARPTHAGEGPGLVLDVVVVSMAGEQRLALLVADDVSEAADARNRALQAERLAAIGKMAAHITHEIRNPLSSIQLNVELLEETLEKYIRSRDAELAPEAKRLLSAIVREVGRLGDVSEEYLRVARLPSPRPAAVDLAALVRDVADFARPELDRARVTLDLRVPDEAVVVAIDEAQVRQALVNLVRNAREAMEDGGTLTLRVSRESGTSGGPGEAGGPHGVAVLEVEDQGPGIPEDVRMRIFDPFFTTKATGTGLGLPLTRQIIEAHGGAIRCEAVEPHGTRFRLLFPRITDKSGAPTSASGRDGARPDLEEDVVEDASA